MSDHRKIVEELEVLINRYRLFESMVHRQSSSPPYRVKYNGGRWHLVSIGGSIDDNPIGMIFDLEADDADNLLTLIKSLDVLVDMLRIIQDIAEPFRYALQQLADKDWHDDHTVFVNGALFDENGSSIQAKDFYKLLNAIYGEFPKIDLPPADQSQEQSA